MTENATLLTTSKLQMSSGHGAMLGTDLSSSGLFLKVLLPAVTIENAVVTLGALFPAALRL
jgi:hypothetical protein